MEDLFRQMTAQGIWRKNNPKQLAIEFYAPFYLFLSIADVSSNKREITELFLAHIEQFIENNIAEGERGKSKWKTSE
jgi:hypothetical protein